MPKSRFIGASTRAIHGRVPRDKIVGAVSTPIYQTATFSQDTPGSPREHLGRKLSYGRTENPTRTVLEEALAEVEGGEFGLAFPSGLAAVTCVMNTLSAGDHVVTCHDLYGGSYRMFTKVYSRLGIDFSLVDATDVAKIRAAMRPNTRLVWLESPSNPLLNITDLTAATTVAREGGAFSVVDNTFASPVLQRPLELGADVVMHSTTKYLNGHSDVLNGALITNSVELHSRLKFVQNACGLIPGPQDSFLVLRGLKTLGVRVARHCENAAIVADHLVRHPKSARVYFPGLSSHPGHELALKQMCGFGAMVSFDVAGGEPAARRFLEALQLFTLAESLGGVASLANHPASMTHASVEPEVREAVGIGGGLVRLSIGIEDIEDIIVDLDRALEQA